MRKNAPLILLFALAVAFYGYSQYWNQNRSARFEAVLLDFLPEEINRIDLQRGADTPFSLRRNEDRWLMSKGNVHETAKSAAIEEILQRLRSIRTAEIVANQKATWEEYGVDDNQGVKICLYKDSDKPLCLRLGRYTYTQERNRLDAFTRIIDQKEVYAINGMSVSLLDGDPDYFRYKQLIELENPIIKMRWKNMANNLEVVQGTGRWLLDNQPLPDSLLWASYTQQLRSFSGQKFADDIDETNLQEKIDWKLTLFTSLDSVQINCYRDSSRQAAFILHSPQFPQTWLSSDSAGIYQELVLPWQKINSNE